MSKLYFLRDKIASTHTSTHHASHDASTGFAAPRTAVYPSATLDTSDPLRATPNRAPECLLRRRPPYALLLRLRSAPQDDLNTICPQWPWHQTRAETAITRIGEQTGNEGRVSKGGNDEAKETQLGREKDCKGAIE